MLRISQLRLPIEHSHEELLLKVQKQLRCKDIQELKIIRRSVDARKKPTLFFEYTVDVKVKGEQELLRKCRSGQVTLVREVPYRFPVSGYQGTVRPVIVGMGPAGLFCGYMLAKAGFRPILLERGKTVETVIERYSKTVKPMYLQFIEPSKRYADIIIPQGGHNKVAIDVISATIEKSLQQKNANTGR